MKLIILIAIISVVALSGCSATTYNKPDNSTDAYKQDMKTCEYEALKAVGPKKNLTDMVMNSSRKDDVIKLCMEARGYKAE